MLPRTAAPRAGPLLSGLHAGPAPPPPEDAGPALPPPEAAARRVAVRPARVADAPEMAALCGEPSTASRYPHNELSDQLRLAVFHEVLPAGKMRVLVATASGRVVGLTMGYMDLSRGICIMDVTVGEAHRRAGIGRTLVLALLAALGCAELPAHLEVAEDNAAARALYELPGFTELRRFPFPDGSPTIAMRRMPAPLRRA
jgi:ribosomal protein S18 acetylase RimI-like enzyme